MRIVGHGGGSPAHRGGLDVVMVDAREETVEALNRDGARIVGNLEVTQPVKAVTPDGMQGIYDLVVYLAKSTYDEAALPQVLPHLGGRAWS